MENALFSQIVQEFHLLAPLDLLTVGTLAILEGILSVDNALILAILVRPLPKKRQRRALTYGIVGAFAFRFVALIFAGYMMRLVVFKLIGGAYLIYLAMKHMFFFTKEEAYATRPKTASSFWMTVLVVEITDIAFSIDSITTAVAMSDKLLIVWMGGILGIVFLRFAASFFIRLLETLPRMEDLAYQLVFFIGTKLALEGFNVEMSHAVFWMMMGVITILGSSLVYRDYHQRTTHTRIQNRLLERLRKEEISIGDLLALESVPKEVIQYLHEKGRLDIGRAPIEKPGSTSAH